MIRILETQSFPSAYRPKEIEVIDEVVIDNVSGEGSTPLNQQVNYMGFVAYMRPTKFLKLALSGIRDEELASSYKGNPIGAPFFNVKYSDEVFKVRGHEGRHRVTGIYNSIGNDLFLPVHIFPRGMKARQLNPEMILGSIWKSEIGLPVEMDDVVFYLDGERIS